MNGSLAEAGDDARDCEWIVARQAIESCKIDCM
jgi:hypothetical protein